jgi:glutaredoxin
VIKLYSKTVCPKCIVAKAILDDSGVEYEVFNLDQDEEAKQKLKDLGFMAAPIIEYNGNFHTNTNQLQELLQDIE